MLERMQSNGWLLEIEQLDQNNWCAKPVRYNGKKMDMDLVFANSRTGVHNAAHRFAQNAKYVPGLGWRL